MNYRFLSLILTSAGSTRLERDMFVLLWGPTVSGSLSDHKSHPLSV